MLGKKLKKHVNDTVEDEVEYNVSIGKIITSYRKEEFMNNIWTKAQSKDLDKRFTEQRKYMDKRFESIDKKFENIDKKFEAMENKFDKKIDEQRKYMENFIINIFKINGMNIPETK